jgi:hypothetical protein
VYVAAVQIIANLSDAPPPNSSTIT